MSHRLELAYAWAGAFAFVSCAVMKLWDLPSMSSGSGVALLPTGFAALSILIVLVNVRLSRIPTYILCTALGVFSASITFSLVAG